MWKCDSQETRQLHFVGYPAKDFPRGSVHIIGVSMMLEV